VLLNNYIYIIPIFTDRNSFWESGDFFVGANEEIVFINDAFEYLNLIKAILRW
jgi:hypothetical protein